MISVDSSKTVAHLKKYRELLEEKFKDSLTQVMTQWADHIVAITPVGDAENYSHLYSYRQMRYNWEPTPGMLMANWKIRLNSYVPSFEPRARDTTGNSLDSAVFFWMEKYKLGDQVHLFNATPYLLNSGINGPYESIQEKYDIRDQAINGIMNLFQIPFRDF